MSKPSLPTITKAHAKELRKRATDAEVKLWYHLRGARLNGLKFRRQHPLPPYIVDFYCESAKLAIEVDGSQHDDVVDLHRTNTIERAGIKILRFWDNEVVQNTQAVLEMILNLAGNRALTPPLSRGEREKEEAA